MDHVALRALLQWAASDRLVYMIGYEAVSMAQCMRKCVRMRALLC
eukprot:COSAG06_NODE_6090_length_3116_cov_3.048724_1_plen_45_part_00